MIVVTAFNGFMSWLQDSELLALYAIVGGLSVPILVSTGENHEATLFSYLLLLDFAVLVLVALRPWSRLLFGGFTGTVLFVTGWWIAYYSNAQSGQNTAIFVGCFFFLFAPRTPPGPGEPRGWGPFSGVGTRLLWFCCLCAMQLSDSSLFTTSSIGPPARGWRLPSPRSTCCYFASPHGDDGIEALRPYRRSI